MSIKKMIKILLAEYETLPFNPEGLDDFNLYRALVNIRRPITISDEYLKLEDEYLQNKTFEKGITDIKDLKAIKDKIYLWQGDITSLKIQSIVNAANSGMLGCFSPLHACIDNVIHTYSGVRLRLACNEIMQKQGCDEKTGTAKITKAYNLPSDYVLHTVGPIISGPLVQNDIDLLKSSYTSCLELACENNISQIAFCCISTGVFSFPKQKAAQIAIDTVSDFLKNDSCIKTVVFNVFTDEDLKIYTELLS